jgi:DNA-binding winged helix-turn-helix (wHTH) protein/Tol biopolymer transport system component
MSPAIGHENKHLYEFGAFRLDPIERVLARDGDRILLAPKAFDTLFILVLHSGHVLTKDELIKALWPDSFVEENNLTQQISLLRRALGEGTDGQIYIETVPKLGYRFIPDVHEITEGAGELLVSKRTRTHIVLQEQVEEEVGDAVDSDSYCSERETKPGLLRVRIIVVLILAGVVCMLVLWLVSAPASVPAVFGFAQLTHDGHYKSGPVFTDGEFVYFQEPDHGKNRMMRVPVKGGEPTPVLTMPTAIAEVDDFSPSRQELLAREWAATDQNESVLLCAVPGGPCRRISGLRATAAAWSPTDDRIFYAQREKVFSARSDGSDPRDLFTARGRVLCMNSSPDGRLLTYLVESTDTKALQFWEARTDGSRARLILSDLRSDFSSHQGTWTPDAKYLFFTQAQDGRESLWALRTPHLFGGGTRTRLNTGLMSISAVAVAAHGKGIFAIGTQGRLEILRYDLKSGSQMPYLAGISADGLAFSRRGDWVAYTAFPEGTLVRRRMDGTQQLELTNKSQKTLLPAWSPDGKRIAYMARGASGSWNGPWKIYMVSSEGGAAEELLPGAGDQGNPTWSPDGNSLIFAGVPWVNRFAPDSTAIYQMDLRTRKVVTLPGSQGLWSPRWSPDGRFLVAETIDSRKLLLFNFSKQTWSPLAEVSSEVIGYTSWSHDSRFVFFNAYIGEQSATLYRVDVLRRITDRFPMPRDLRQPIILGQWFALAPDDTPLVLRDISVRELFAFDIRLP